MPVSKHGNNPPAMDGHPIDSYLVVSAKKMTAYKVSTRVGSPKNNDAEIIAPL